MSFGCVLMSTFVVAFTLLSPIYASALAQNSAGLIAKDPQGQYETIKTMLAPDVESMRSELEKNPDPNLQLCGDVVPGSEDALTSLLSQLAGEMLWASLVLTTAQYPQAIWQEPLNQIERAVLSGIVGRGPRLDEELSDVKLLLERLAKFRSESNSGLPEMIWGACGGNDQTPVKIKTVPAGGEVWIIASFFHQLCQKQKLDADNPDQCNHGREYSDGSETQGLGTYRYVAKWRGGAVRKGQLDFDDSRLPTVPCAREQKGSMERCAVVTINARQ